MKTTNYLYQKYRKNITSQYGEDGIIEEIFRRLNITGGAILDIGAADGKWFSNTYTLLERGFDVYAIERSERAKKLLGLKSQFNNLHPLQIEVSTDKSSSGHINAILKNMNVPMEIELMSLDIDSIDPWVFEDMDRNPKVVILEIEPRYYPLDMKMHNPSGNRETNPPQNITGFLPMYKIAKKRGYTLICHTISNIFFLRNDMIESFNSPEVTGVNELTNFSPAYLSEADKKRWAEFQISDKPIKVCIPESNFFKLQSTILNLKLFEQAGIEFVSDLSLADYLLVVSATPYPELKNKTIYISREPPIVKSVWDCYNSIDSFKLAIVYNPSPDKKNQMGFNPDNYPNWVSVRPVSVRPETRSDTTMRNRGIFFAGNIKEYNNGAMMKQVGATGINHIRKVIGEHCLKVFQDSKIIGCGWKDYAKPTSWHADKMKQIRESNTDFVLALENTIMPNYLTEKIWDGLYSDKVTLYLGDPNVDRFIPTNCFVDLRPYYDINSGVFDVIALENKIKNMTQQEYDSIISNARKIRTTFSEKKELYRNKLTAEVIKKIKGWCVNSGNESIYV